MDRDEAIRLIHELIAVEVQSMKEISSRGKTTRKTDARELRAVTKLFQALTGSEPTREEWAEIIMV